MRFPVIWYLIKEILFALSVLVNKSKGHCVLESRLSDEILERSVESHQMEWQQTKQKIFREAF